MRRFSLPVLAVLAAACSAAFTWGGGQPPGGFRLADASAACRVQGARLVCANLTARSGLALPGRGGPRAVDARVWWDASTPVLRSWRHGALSCRADAGAIVCHNGTGAAISVGGAQLSVAL
jgi:hypothetical protein